MAPWVCTVGLPAPLLCSTLPVSRNTRTVFLRTLEICLQECKIWKIFPKLSQKQATALYVYSPLLNTITKVRFSDELMILLCSEVKIIFVLKF
jgi:hypothetical protein